MTGHIQTIEPSATKEPVRTATSPLRHSADAVLSVRHATSFMLLTMGAGAVNAGAFIACERFVAHVTGNVTRIGLDASAWVLMLEYVAVLVAFVVGAMLSVAAIQARAFRGERPRPGIPLLMVVATLCVAALAGYWGVFGPVGGHAEKPTDFALLYVLAGAMGLMNASVASSTAYAVRITHMTGPATDLAVHLATAWYARGEERKLALRLAGLRGGKILAFVVGAALMVPLMHTIGYLAFMMPALFVLVGTLRSFVSFPLSIFGKTTHQPMQSMDLVQKGSQS
ncbi:MAG: DUF1275 domain-containing protein [Sandaracinaceae bacterium]|nr:DUF1275 domain-containing protein [Sandaracinaceae bacterium]